MTNLLARDLDHVLAHTAGAWEELRGARIFVTGGTGFFGRWLLESFLWAEDRLRLDARLTVLTRNPECFRLAAPRLAAHPAITLAEGDIGSFRLENARFSHVVHAATASAREGRESPLAAIETMVDGTRRVLEFATASGARRFLFTSSGAVYGRQPSAVTHIAEDYEGAPDPLDARSVYGEGKRMAELLCAAYARTRGLECPIARGFAFVGPHLPLDAEFAIGNFIGDCLAGRPIVIRGDGSPYRSYLYAADLAIWLWTILVRGVSGRAYNVGAEREVTIAELARTVRSTLGARNEIQILGRQSHAEAPAAPPERYVPSTARAREELGLHEWIPLEEGIRRTAAWHTPSFFEAHP